MKEFLAYVGLRAASGIVCLLPAQILCALGRFLGGVAYYFDRRHRSIAYRNLRLVFSSEKSITEIREILRENYKNFGQSIMETLYIPRINAAYVERYIRIENVDKIDEALKCNSGLFILGIHFGSWEIANMACRLKGYPYLLIVRDQKESLLEDFLNHYRRLQGCELAGTSDSARAILKALRTNMVIGLVADHGGGKKGEQIDFLGKEASTPSGAVRLSLRLQVPLFLAVPLRIQGPYQRIMVSGPLVLKDTGNLKEDIQDNLRLINRIFEGYIREYPEHYLWFYKRWKYSRQRNVLILDDGRLGHLRQSQALVSLMQEGRFSLETSVVKIEYKNVFCRWGMLLVACCGCRGLLGFNLWALKVFLRPDSYRMLTGACADLVISTGSSLAAVNQLICADLQARSIVILKPSLLPYRRFDLVVLPAHDQVRKGSNVITIKGSLNVISPERIQGQAEGLTSRFKEVDTRDSRLKIGILLGGPAKAHVFSQECIRQFLSEGLKTARQLGAQILITTSRRTPAECEGLVGKLGQDNPRYFPLVVIASQDDDPSVIGGILGLAQIIVVTGESISMVSEAASSGRYALVVRPQASSPRAGRKHERFLSSLAKEGIIYLVSPGEIGEWIERLWGQKPPVKSLGDDFNEVRRAAEGLLS